MSSANAFGSSAWPYPQSPASGLRYPFSGSTPTSSTAAATPSTTSKANSYASTSSDQNSRFPRVPDVNTVSCIHVYSMLINLANGLGLRVRNTKRYSRVQFLSIRSSQGEQHFTILKNLKLTSRDHKWTSRELILITAEMYLEICQFHILPTWPDLICLFDHSDPKLDHLHVNTTPHYLLQSFTVILRWQQPHTLLDMEWDQRLAQQQQHRHQQPFHMILHRKLH